MTNYLGNMEKEKTFIILTYNHTNDNFRIISTVFFFFPHTKFTAVNVEFIYLPTFYA